jgi:hypothetical protein
MGEGDPTSSGTPSYDSRRVPTYKPQDPAEPPVDPTKILPATGSAPPAPAPKQATSTQLAEKSQRQRRRERDARAEKIAQRSLVIGFLAIGGLGLWVVNSGYLDQPEPAGGAAQADLQPGTAAPPPPPPEPRKSAVPDETPDIPALASLKNEGLTIAAEGLPEVLAIDPPNPPAILAGIETCRFAYGIWEFSPNRAFRFITTCSALQGQILVGAYEVRGSRIVTSPLVAEPAQVVSVFDVEKPSHVRTEVTITGRDGNQVRLEVKQRLTTMRPGMEGEGFYRGYAPKNTLEIQGLSAPREGDRDRRPAQPAPAPQQQPGPKDPVLELLEKE